MKVIILGTGATSGTLGVRGGVNHFVMYLKEKYKEQDLRDIYPNLTRVIHDCADKQGRPGLDRIWTRIDYYSKFKRILGCDYGASASIELHKAVLEAYSFNKEIHDFMLNSREKDFTLKKELKALKKGDVLISFNWDTLGEEIAVNMLSKDLFQAPYHRADINIRLTKPHGSLSWIHYLDGCGGSVIYRNGNLPRLDTMALRDVNTHRRPLVLGAVPIKSELLQEIQRDQGNLYEVIAAQWCDAVDALSQTSEIVVLGYSFPREDVYGRFLFHEAFRRRDNGKNVPKIRYYSLYRDRLKIICALREIAGKNIKYEYVGRIT